MFFNLLFLWGPALVFLGLSVNFDRCRSLLSVSESGDHCSAAKDDSNLRFDCLPDVNVTKVGLSEAMRQCAGRGCCWSPVDPAGQNLSGPVDPRYPENRYPIHIGPPPCFLPNDWSASYEFVEKMSASGAVEERQPTERRMKRKANTTSAPFPNNIDDVKVEVIPQSNNRLRIKISDAKSARYEVPLPVLSPPKEPLTSPNYEVRFGNEFGFAVLRKDTGETIFNATVGDFIIADQFLQLSAILSTRLLYGLSQSHDTFARSFEWQKCPLFASLLFPDYGSHPFYLAIEKSGRSHGVFLFNSNAMDVLLQPTPAITYRVTGGVLDLYFLLGPTPEDVVRQYTQLVGLPSMIPYWSLGFHLSKYGYGSLNNTRDAWKRNKDAGIPFDVQWNDIDYMAKGYKIFTYDNVTYDGLPQFVKTLHDNDMRYVSIIDAGIDYVPGENYGTCDRGLEANVFIRNSSGGFANGKVWPTYCVFTDFTNPNASSYWTNEYQLFHDLLPYDGTWIDMNEITTFTFGSVDGKCPKTKWDDPPYVPDVWGNNLAARTICMSNVLYNGIEYNLHNLYGLTMTISTHQALKKVLNKRPFVMTRSTAPGNGKYGTHWTGDVYSSWQDFRQVIPSILNMNMFGIPMVGADICGFRENTTFELCHRWTQLGAFNPFARNHNERGNIDQDPAAFGPQMIEIFKNAFNIRYSLLPFMYTQFYRVHIEGGTVIRPLFFEFINDSSTYLIEDQFMWGRELMIFPVLKEGATSVEPYFPKALWYLWPNVSRAMVSQGGRSRIDLPDPASVVVAIRGGSIIPTQKPSQTTNASRKNKFGLLVAVDEYGKATGNLFWDDGQTIDTVEKSFYSLINFAVSQNSLLSTVVKYFKIEDSDFTLGSATLLGIQKQPNKVLINKTDNVQFLYDYDSQSLQLTNMSVPLSAAFTIQWI